MEVERDVAAWESSSGPVRGHRVLLRLEPDLRARVDAAPSVVDALTAAFAAAVAGPGEAMSELTITEGPREARSPYR